MISPRKGNKKTQGCKGTEHSEKSEFGVRSSEFGKKEHRVMNLLPEVPQVQMMVYPFLALQTAIFLI